LKEFVGEFPFQSASLCDSPFLHVPFLHVQRELKSARLIAIVRV
jgi:hypothetical protein